MDFGQVRNIWFGFKNPFEASKMRRKEMMNDQDKYEDQTYLSQYKE